MFARKSVMQCCGLLVLLLFAGRGWPAEAPFYQGKTLTVVEGRAAGGLGSLRAKVVASHLQRYLPGNPPIVYQYMAGGGGTAAANHLASVARRDGLTIANIGSSIFSNALLGGSGVRYQLDDFVFLGSAYSGNPFALVIRPALGLDSVEKLKAYSGLRFANRSVGHSTYIADRLAAFTLELKDARWILGYTDQEINPAIERGEADTRVMGIPLFLREAPHWLKQGFTVPVVLRNTKGRGAETFPEFPQDRPTLDRYADTELKRAILKFHNATRPVSSVYLVPKGIPDAALRTLREAFNKAWDDPRFKEEYERLTQEPADPVTGEEIDEILKALPQDPRVREIYKQLIGAGPVPPGR
jgi:tripartite-type tricarboxylate transporter receptor subunit TctC